MKYKIFLPARLRTALILAACCLTASCTSKATQRNAAMGAAIDEGDYLAMIGNIKKNGKSLYGEASAFLYNMDLGVLFHYAGEYDSSNVYLMKAADVHDRLFTKSVTNEAAALLTNDNVRPYRSKPYELIMMHQLTALNFMATGKFNEALVETRKSQLLMNEWERTEAKDGKYHTDGMSHLLSSLAYEGAGETDNSLISLFKSVEAYKKGPVALPAEVEGFAYDRLKAGDRENDIKTLGIGPGGGKWGAGQGEAEIVVVGYAGRGPTLKEQNWYGNYVPSGVMKIYVKETQRVLEIPAPPLPAGKNAGAGGLAIKVSLPELQTFPSNVSYFTASLDNASEARSAVINDFDKQAEKALADAWNSIVTRTIIRVVTRTIAANEAKNRLKSDNPWANLAASLATDIAADQMEKADVRICFMLPKTVHVARIPVEPGTHSVTLAVRDNEGNVVGKRVFSGVVVRKGEKRVLLAHQLRGGEAGPVAVPPAEYAPPVARARTEAAPEPLVEPAVVDAEDGEAPAPPPEPEKAAEPAVVDAEDGEAPAPPPEPEKAAEPAVVDAEDGETPAPPPEPEKAAEPVVAGGGHDAIDMALVKGGTFTMGCTAEQSDMCFANEKPSHNVTLNDFYVGKFEVTQGQWVQVMGANPSHFKGDSLPVENVSWLEAQEFIAKLNSLTGKRYRLPTEAEWEYAARGGAGGRFNMYAGSNNADDVAWYSENSGDKTQPVGSKAPNELGLYDMSGNVNEWVSDWLGAYRASGAVNPTGPDFGHYRVIRGGIWSDVARYCRVSNRVSARQEFKGSNLGFRLALSADTALGPAAAEAPARQAVPAYEPRGRPYIAVYVRGGIEDDEVKTALASELLFDLVNSGLYRPVEDAYAFAAAREEAAKQGGELDDGQTARIGGGAKADLVCVVDAAHAYGALQVSARIIDVNSAAVLKMAVADGKVTTAEEFSAMAEKLAAALIGGAAEPETAEASRPSLLDEGRRRLAAAEPVPAPAPAPAEERRYPPPQERKVRVSIGTGGFFAGGYGGGIGWPNGVRIAMPYSGGGWYAFFDGEYVELTFGYHSGGGKWVSAAASYPDKLPNMPRSGVNFGAFLKIPSSEEGGLRGFPLVGIDYESTSGKLKYGYGGGYALNRGDLSALWFKLGGGLDIALSENVYLRSELLFGWRTANDYEKNAIRTERTYGKNANTVQGSGLSAKCGLGYKF